MAKVNVRERGRKYLALWRPFIERVGGEAEGLYRMPSSSDPDGEYLVRVDPADCPCPYFSIYADCKHRQAGLILEREEYADPNEQVVITRATLNRLLKLEEEHVHE
jgi:hypothetical protein